MEYLEIMHAWHDGNPNLFENFLWISADQNQDHWTDWNNRNELLLPLFFLNLEEKCQVCIFQVTEVCVKLLGLILKFYII